jgi:hypothetical protein
VVVVGDGAPSYVAVRVDVDVNGRTAESCPPL